MELIKKIKSLLPEVITKLQKEDKDGAIQSLQKLAEEVNDAEETETGAETPTPEEVEKMVATAVAEAVKKFADLYVSSETVEALKKQLEVLTTASASVEKLAEKVEKLESASNGSKQLEPVNKTEPSIWDE